jgi:hypothetical protein
MVPEGLLLSGIAGAQTPYGRQALRSLPRCRTQTWRPFHVTASATIVGEL